MRKEEIAYVISGMLSPVFIFFASAQALKGHEDGAGLFLLAAFLCAAVAIAIDRFVFGKVK